MEFTVAQAELFKQRVFDPNFISQQFMQDVIGSLEEIGIPITQVYSKAAIINAYHDIMREQAIEPLTIRSLCNCLCHEQGKGYCEHCLNRSHLKAEL